MGDYSTVTLLGRFAKDPLVRFIASTGTAVCTFPVAVEFPMKENKKEVSFFDVVVFGKMGETVAETGRKGQRVAVCGRLRQRSWEQDGKKRYAIEVISDYVFTRGLPEGSSAGGSGPPGGSPPPGGGAEERDIPF